MITARSIVVVVVCAALVGPGVASPLSDRIARQHCPNDVRPASPSSSEPRAITYPCKCEESKCSCCSGNVLQNFNLNFRQRLCTNITYNADDFEFNVRILFNDYTLYNRVVSGSNPRPICVPIFPPAWTQSRVCLKFSNIYFVGRNVHVCLGMELQTEKKPVFAVDFNCVRMGTQGVALLKPEDGGGLPVPLPQDPADSPQVVDPTTAATAVAAASTAGPVVQKNTINKTPPNSIKSK